MPAIWKTPAGEQAVKTRYEEILKHWPVPCEQHRFATAQGETFALACGPADAPPVVLLHGSASNSAMWMGDVPAWAQDFRLYAVDVIGEPGFSAAHRPTLASGAYLTWLDEVMAGLGLEAASIVGISLGGWLALHYATHRPERTHSLALLAPGGVGRHKNVLLWAAPLLLLGNWGRRRVMARIGRPDLEASPSPAAQAFGAFMALIFANFRPRGERLPRFTDEALSRLTMPVMAVLGGRDVFIDSPTTRDRLTSLAAAEITYLPEAGHFLPGQTAAVHDFLRRATRP